MREYLRVGYGVVSSSALLMVVALTLVASCGGGSGGDPCGPGGCLDSSDDSSVAGEVTIQELRHASPLLPGSMLLVRGEGLSDLGEETRLVFSPGTTQLPLEDRDGNELLFRVSQEVVDQLGPSWSGTLLLVIGANTVASIPANLTFAQSLPPTLTEVALDQVHFNDPVLLRGDGLLEPSEGQSTLLLSGSFTDAQGASRDVEGELPVMVAEAFARDRGTALFDTSLLGVETGQFQGLAMLKSRTAAGQEQTSGSIQVAFDVVAPELFLLSASTVRLGQYVELLGAGFLGSAVGSGGKFGETTVIEVSGTYVEAAGGEESKVEGVLVPKVVSGEKALFFLESAVGEKRLVSALFGKRSGSFSGTFKPVVSRSGGDSMSGSETAVKLEIITTGQVVHVSFLPGFDKSLALFGLQALEPEVKQGIADVIEDIYKDYDVDVRLDVPDDFDKNHYALVEIGGPDPNGIGLMGFDNTPGKDVGNLRLFDAIGGNNLETQADGYPGFGGVFIEAFLYLSYNPPFDPSAKPAGAPAPVEQFDLIFDPVRNKTATLAEYKGECDERRCSEVKLAVQTLINLVGETTAHEIGHSFGLADPNGSANVYHNPVDQPGCLMDAGNDRSFGERAKLPGEHPVRFCYDHPEYLLEVLGPRRK